MCLSQACSPNALYLKYPSFSSYFDFLVHRDTQGDGEIYILKMTEDARTMEEAAVKAFIPSQKHRKASRNCQNQYCHNFWKQSKVYIMK